MMLRVLTAVVLALGVVRVAAAQDTTRALQLADRGPRFLYAPTHGEVPADARGAMVFKRTIALSVADVPVADALVAIGRAAGIRIVYKTEVLPAGTRVSMEAARVTLAAALTDVLQDIAVDVELTGSGIVTLVPRPAAGAPSRRTELAADGTIAGSTTDSSTGATVPYVIVRVDETGQSAQSSAQGRYTIAGVAPGQYRVTARRVGFLAKARPVIVEEGKTATLNFALNQPPTKIDEVVTTALGDQRRYEVGNSIARINVDSLAPTTPVTSLTDIISARAPGVEVLQNSGMTGSGEAIRIRGLSSLVLQNDPILIVDGVRQDNSAGGDIGAYSIGGGYHPTPSRINDIDFSDVETIDILKGPAASTEYGTDAANGVIVITTKHGTAGRPQWHISAERTASDIPGTFPNNYYSWGHTTDGQHSSVNCPLLPGTIAGYSSSGGSCTVDSVTRWNPLNHKATSIFGTGDRQKYDLSVGGGTDAIRYYLAGGLSNEAGILRMPPVFRHLADSTNVGLPRAAFNPNSEQQRSARVNTTIRLGSTADLGVSASYLSTYQQTPDANGLFRGVFTSPALSDAAHSYGYTGFGGFYANANTPLAEFSQVGSQNTDRATGGLSLSWRPLSWFVGHATAGVDHGSQGSRSINYPISGSSQNIYGPLISVANITTDVYSADLRGTATASLTHDLRAVTSVGVQMFDTRAAGQSAFAGNITPLNLTLNGASHPSVAQVANRQATLGGYGEEQLAFADRLFLTGALRVDAASGFGSAYSTAAYPKASVSWLAVNQGPTTLRLRGAFGESGVQPQNGAALQLYRASTTYLGGTTVSTTSLAWPGNPNLKPERSAEFEGGVDVGGWRNRLTVEFTAYSKTTHDALVNVPLGPTLGYYTYQENIGEVRNTGLEGTVTAALVQSRSLTWDVAVNASVNHNTLVSLAPGVLPQSVYGLLVTYRQSPGYPLYGIWAPKVTYTDANHDGIIERNEVHVADSASYQGASLPTQEVSVSTHVGLFGGAVTVGALVDYRGGYKIANEQLVLQDLAGNSAATNDPHSPLAQQARALVNRQGFNALDVQDGSFVRFRELSVTYTAPRSVVRAMRAASVSVTAAVRNLALWTRYRGGDPEASNSAGSEIQYNPGTNSSSLNNDVRADFGTVPLARYWVLRLNVGF